MLELIISSGKWLAAVLEHSEEGCLPQRGSSPRISPSQRHSMNGCVCFCFFLFFFFFSREPTMTARALLRPFCFVKRTVTRVAWCNGSCALTGSEKEDVWWQSDELMLGQGVRWRQALCQYHTLGGREEAAEPQSAIPKLLSSVPSSSVCFLYLICDSFVT